jgi:hypothetical protein
MVVIERTVSGREDKRLFIEHRKVINEIELA